ncbi:MAG TPA: hypothetical protein VFN88_01120 [Caulobacteraceae bacterium]|nr:hypothetical protein [Caulobacteraceae bacterium]
MHHINPAKAGLAFGSVLGLFHLVWAILVATGVAQPVLDFILGLHFIELTLKIAPFNVGTAAALVVITAASGFVLGAVLAVAWNQFSGAAGAAAPARPRVA